MALVGAISKAAAISAHHHHKRHHNHLSLPQVSGAGDQIPSPHIAYPSQVQQQSNADCKDWDAEGLRCMGKPGDYKKRAPIGYKEQIRYKPGDEDTNTDADFARHAASINAEAARLSAAASHAKPTYPNITPFSMTNRMRSQTSEASSGDDIGDLMALGGKVGLKANPEAEKQLQDIKNGGHSKPPAVTQNLTPVQMPTVSAQDEEDMKMTQGGRLGQQLMKSSTQQKLENIMKALEKKPAVASLPQQNLGQRERDDYWPSIEKPADRVWEGNIIPNPWAWTEKHHDSSDEAAYSADTPVGYPHPSFAQQGTVNQDGPYNWPDNRVPSPWLGNLHHNPSAWTADNLIHTDEEQYAADAPNGVPGSAHSQRPQTLSQASLPYPDYLKNSLPNLQAWTEDQLDASGYEQYMEDKPMDYYHDLSLAQRSSSSHKSQKNLKKHHHRRSTLNQGRQHRERTMPTYPTKGSHSWLEPGGYRENAWTQDQYTNTSAPEYTADSPAGYSSMAHRRHGKRSRGAPQCGGYYDSNGDDACAEDVPTGLDLSDTYKLKIAKQNRRNWEHKYRRGRYI